MRPTSAGHSALLLLDVIQVLNERQIPYAIVGAFAASFYGMVRASLDADAIISIYASEDALALCAGLLAQGLVVEHRWGDQDDPIAAVINIQDQFHNRVDLLIGIRGMKPEIFSRTVDAKFMEATIKIVSPEDFIALKVFAGSPKDIQDVIGVLQVSTEKINLKFLKELTSQYGAQCAQKLESLLKEFPLENER